MSSQQLPAGLMPLTIGFFGDGTWSHEALAKLLADDSVRVAFVCARFDRPDAHLRKQSEGAGIDFLVHANVNSEEFLQRVAGYRCDLFVSMSFNQIFRERLTSLPRMKTINCHAGKLPFYRGRNVLNWALINDEREFGITVHYIDEGIDTGDIIAQRTYPITDRDTYSTLLERAHHGCADLLYEAVKQLQGGRATRVTQSSIHPTGFYCSMRQEGDEQLRWNANSRDVFNFVRAICRPGPEARTTCRSVEIRINRVELVRDAPVYRGVPGAVLGSAPDSLIVKTADSFVKVVEWSSPQKIRTGDRFE
jgi:methionyl-tRNA formyltransferase